MANKTITELQLRETVEDTLNVPVDDTLQSYRITIAMIKAWILATGNVVTAAIADLGVTTAKLAAGAVTDAKTSFTKPTIQRLTSGSGTYNTPANVKYIHVKMVGGGGGGGGANNVTPGTTGGVTTFGTSLLTANGGVGGSHIGVSNGGGIGGTATVNSPALTIVAIQGGQGDAGSATVYAKSGLGAGTFFGSGGSGANNAAGYAALANSGGGGAGGSTNGAGTSGGNGGGAGGMIEALIPSPSATYAYAVGSGGAGASAGANGFAGGSGGSGLIVVTEYYQ